MAADPSPEPAAPPSALAPLARPVFRALWIAALVSNVGYWMQSVGAVWQVGSEGGSAAQVALVQTAVSLPVVLLALPSGAAADVFDRRRLLLTTQTWMLLSAAALCLLAIGLWAGIRPEQPLSSHGRLPGLELEACDSGG